MISTDTQQIEELLSRGVENVYPKRDFLAARLASGKQLTLYTGYDPTAPSLHIGHGITMVKLRQFQDLGHKIVMLIGDFTGMIGDPTDKGAARKTLTHDECVANAKEYMKQASAILNFEGENPVEVKYNGEWLGKLMTADWLDITAQFTVQQMMERDMFQKRLEEEKPVFIHELLYPLMQGFDSVAMNVDGEVGGNDQTFNMLTGRDMMNNEAIMAKYGVEKKTKEKFVLTTKLLADDSGKKMSKSEGNAIFLSDSPEDMFGKVMRFSDGMIMNAFELATRVPVAELGKIKEDLDNGANPRDAKLMLAFEITKTFLGESAAGQGRDHFKSVIQEKDKPEEIADLTPSAYDIVTVLVEAGFCKSKSEARAQIDGKGVRVHDEVVSGYDVITKSGDVVQKGKRFFVRIV
jgi:tyrosyl-tRNA synthetase